MEHYIALDDQSPTAMTIVFSVAKTEEEHSPIGLMDNQSVLVRAKGSRAWG